MIKKNDVLSPKEASFFNFGVVSVFLHPNQKWIVTNVKGNKIFIKNKNVVFKLEENELLDDFKKWGN